MAHCEVTENWDGTRAPTAIQCYLGLKFHPLERANAIADCLEEQFTPYDLCDDSRERKVETTVQALLEAVDNESPEKNWTM
jgi:hypothetical protein